MNDYRPINIKSYTVLLATRDLHYLLVIETLYRNCTHVREITKVYRGSRSRMHTGLSFNIEGGFTSSDNVLASLPVA